MRALLERSRAARVGVVVTSLAIVLTLVHGATAGNDPGFRRETSWPDNTSALQFVDVPVVAPARHRQARRIWAASQSRPLRISLSRRAQRVRLARARRVGAPASGAPAAMALLRRAAEPQVVFPKLKILPKPPVPAVVSIYEDRTLRSGDAVMMADGIHVFRSSDAWPHRPRDFVRLTFAAALDWHLRRSLDALDRNPPTRWSSIGSSAG